MGLNPFLQGEGDKGEKPHRQAQGPGSVSELAELCVISCSGRGFSFLFGQ